MLLARTKGLTWPRRPSGTPSKLVPAPGQHHHPHVHQRVRGSLVIERIFSIPGVGSIMIDAINARDHALTIAVLIFYSILSLLTIFIMDVSYGIIDPRVRVGRRNDRSRRCCRPSFGFDKENSLSRSGTEAEAAFRTKPIGYFRDAFLPAKSSMLAAGHRPDHFPRCVRADSIHTPSTTRIRTA